MLRALLVDDEPFILQGLKVLIDWQKEGVEIVETAENGAVALEYLRHEKIDLIIADINMPVVSGLQLLKQIREEEISDAYFVILSGYADFSYAQEAIRHDCSEYILKPVERDDLIEVLHKVRARENKKEQTMKASLEMREAFLARNIISLIQGKYDEKNLTYVKEHMHLSSGVQYIEIKLDEGQMEDEMSDQEKRNCQHKLFDACLGFLKEDGCHCVLDVSGQEKIYDIGLVFCDYMAAAADLTNVNYLNSFLTYLRGVSQLPVVMLVGKKVKDISSIAKSYATACVLRSIQGFRMKKDIFYYEEEVQVTDGGIVLCKKSLDALLKAIEQNEHGEIRESITLFFEEMKQMGFSSNTVKLNVNYLLFQLIHLASEQDDGVNQEEILRFIGESSFEEGIMRGSKDHLLKFACEYADYLTQLRGNVSRGVLGEVEREIRENYDKNLTLRGLSEKYYVNSAYLGQIFRKKYGCSFKDYLNNYRMNQAATLLMRTDQKIYQIAEAVGYHDLDYFVNRFINVKGCTPAKFRKQVCSLA